MVFYPSSMYVFCMENPKKSSFFARHCNNYYPTFGKRGIPNSRKASTYFVIDDLHFHSMPAVTVQSNGRVEKHSFPKRSFKKSLCSLRSCLDLNILSDLLEYFLKFFSLISHLYRSINVCW